MAKRRFVAAGAAVFLPLRTMRFSSDKAAYFADTPAGVFTAAGTWYRTREQDLQRFAAPALEAPDLTPLLRGADLLVGAPRTLVLWLVPLLLLVLPWTWAAVWAVVLFALLTLTLPALATPPLVRLLRLLDPVVGQMLFYLFVLSLLAARGEFAALWMGLGLFVALRWGLLSTVLRPVADRLYAPALADRVLRALIVRTALRRGVAMPEVAEMERSLLATLHHRR